MPRPEANSPALPPDDEATGRLNRLSAAMELFLQFRSNDEHDRAALLQQHADLADLLEPMFADLDEEQAKDNQRHQQHEEHEEGEAVQVAPDPLQPGRQIGDYRIIREAGRGGMGTVFEAQQISLDRRVALKVLHPHLSWSAGSISRFRKEAAAAARLQHPAIVPIHEVGEWHGLHFFSMEFVDGQPLNEVLHKQRLGVRNDCTRAVEAAELVAQVADALQHAHSHRLIHRDVKPQNIMITDGGSVRLLDFGLVKDFAADSNTAHGTFFGTPHYCSPEQAQHDLEVGPQTDVFSLAIVLYELITRHRPFEGDTSRLILQRIESGTFRPLRQITPAAPRDLETICHKALEVDPAARYATAGEMADDLRRFLRIEPIKAKPPGTVVRGLKWTRRNRVRVALWGALAVIVVGGSGSYMLMQHQALVTANRERVNLDKSEDLGFQSIEQTLTLLDTQLERSPTPPVDGNARVDEIVRVCEEFLSLRAQDEKSSLRVAGALDSTSNIYRQLGQFDAALAACVRGLAIVAGTSETKANQRLKGRLLLRKFQIGQLLQPTSGDAEFAEALSHLKPLCLGDDADLVTCVIYAKTLLSRAQQLTNAFNRYDDARQLLMQGLEMLPEKRVAASTGFIRTQAELCRLRIQTSLGIALLKSNKTKQALALLIPTQAKLLLLPRTGARGVLTTLTTAAIGFAQRQLGQRGAAERSLREAIDAADAQRLEFPGDHTLRRTWIRCRLRLSNMMVQKRKFAEAEQLMREIPATPQVGRKETSQDRHLRAQVTSQLAACSALSGKPGSAAEAQQLWTTSCELMEQLVAEQPENLSLRSTLGGDLGNLAAINNQTGNHDKAAHLARKAIALQEHVLASIPKHTSARSFLGIHHGQLAFACANLGEYEPAIAAATTAFKQAPRNTDMLRICAMAATHCSVSVLQHTELDEVQCLADSERYATVAVKGLSMLANCNAKVANHVMDRATFDHLRSRSDFKALHQSSKR
ncbi:MAG: serine/threonine protein kinase [Planctomycetota bacterium]|jgi:serine/threonine protein kinase